MATTAAAAAAAAESSAMTLGSSPSSMPIESELQQRVLSLALARLSESLEAAADSDSLQRTCEQLGVEHRALADAVREQLRKEERKFDGEDDSASVQVYGRSEDVASSTSSRLIAALVQDLSAAFFSQEVLHGERALGDARARLGALWDKHMELTEEREKTLRGLKLTSDTRNLFASLAQALTQQTRGQEHCNAQTLASTTHYLFGGEALGLRPAMSMCCVAGDGSRSPGFGVDLPLESCGESPAARTKPFAVSPLATTSPGGSSPLVRSPGAGSPTSRIPMPRAGRRRRTVSAATSPTASTAAAASGAQCSSHGREEITVSSEPPRQQRRRFLSPPSSPMLLRGGLMCKRCGEGGDGGGVVWTSGAGEGSSGGALGGCSFSAAAAESGDNFDPGRMKKEIEGLRGQRDALMRSLSFARAQYADALGDKPVQIKGLTGDVDQLRRASVCLREELAEERRGQAENTALLEGKVATFREAAEGAARRLEEAERRTAIAETRVSGVEAEHADATEVVEKKILTLKARLNSAVTERGSLQESLDATLSEMEGVLESNSTLRAEADARGRADEESPLLRQASIERAAAVAKSERLLKELDDAKDELSSLRADAVSLRDADRATAAEAAVEVDVLRASLERVRLDAVSAMATAEAKIAAAEARATAESVVAAEEKAAKIEAASDAKAAAATTATAVDERHAWAVRSGEWEYEAERLTNALKELEAALDAARRELAGAQEGLREAGLRREEEAAVMGEREAGLKNELELAQASVRAFMTDELKAARVTEAAIAATATELADLRGSLHAARAHLGEVEEERDSALQSLLEFAQIRTARTLRQQGDAQAAGGVGGDGGRVDDVVGGGGVVSGGESRSCAFSSDGGERRVQVYSVHGRIGSDRGGGGGGGGGGGNGIGSVVRSKEESVLRTRGSWNPAYAVNEEDGGDGGVGGLHDDTRSNVGAYEIVRERNGGAVHEDDLTFVQDAAREVREERGDGFDDGLRAVVVDDDADNVRHMSETETFSSSAGGALSSIPSVESSRLNEGDAWVHDTSDHVSAAAGSGDGGTDSGGEQECRVCGAPSSARRKLFDCRLSLGRLRVDAMEALRREGEAAEGAAAAAEDAIASRCERKAAEDSLAENVCQLKAVQSELLQVSSSARERDAAANHEREMMSTRLAEVETQLVEREAAALANTKHQASSARLLPAKRTSPDLSCAPDTARAYPAADDSITRDSTELEIVKAALDQTRADLAERSRELHALRAHASATASSAAAAAKADAVSVAEAAHERAAREIEEVKEAGGKSLRLAQAEAESMLVREREKMELGAAEATARAVAAAVASTTGLVEEKAAKEAGAVATKELAKAARDTKAAKEASARYAADLSVAERERDMLEAECARLQARVDDMEDAKLASDAMSRQTEGANAERVEAVRRSFEDETCRREQMESLLTTTREALEQRLAAAENAATTATAELASHRRLADSQARAAADRLSAESTAAKAAQREARQAWQREARKAEARVLEKAEGEAEASTAALKKEMGEAVETMARREGEIATLKVRIRSAEEDVETARRESFLEGHARSAAELAGAGKKAAEACSTAEALRQRCERQEEAIAELASAREEEAEACRVARASLTKERLGLAKSEARERQLQNEVGRLVSSLGDTPKPREPRRRRGREEMEGDTETPPFAGGEVQGTTWDGGRLAEAIGGGSGSGGGRVEGVRETKERERMRSAVFALEESLHAALEEGEHLRRRVARLRAGLREAELRGDEMEAAASLARAAASAARAAAEAATTEAEIATARAHEAEQKTRAVSRREQERTDALQAELSRAASDARVERGRGEEEREDTSRLRSALGESDRRIAVLEEFLAASAADLREAEAGKARAQIDLVRGLGGRGGLVEGRGGGGEGGGEVWGGGGEREDSDFFTGQVTAVNVGMEEDEVLVEVGVSADGGRLLQVTGIAATPPPTPLSDSLLPVGRKSDGRFRSGNPRTHTTSVAVETDSGSEATMLRERLAASQAQHQELVAATKRAVARCCQRCDARVRTALAAGTLASACCRRRGMIAGRESAVEAAAQHSLVRRCFAALRERALRSSRDRSVRRQERLQQWVGEAVRWSGEELSFATTTMKNSRNR